MPVVLLFIGFTCFISPNVQNILLKVFIADINYLYLCACVPWMDMGVKGQLMGIGSLLPPTQVVKLSVKCLYPMAISSGLLNFNFTHHQSLLWVALGACTLDQHPWGLCGHRLKHYCFFLSGRKCTKQILFEEDVLNTAGDKALRIFSLIHWGLWIFVRTITHLLVQTWCAKMSGLLTTLSFGQHSLINIVEQNDGSQGDGLIKSLQTRLKNSTRTGCREPNPGLDACWAINPISWAPPSASYPMSSCYCHTLAKAKGRSYPRHLGKSDTI